MRIKKADKCFFYAVVAVAIGAFILGFAVLTEASVIPATSEYCYKDEYTGQKVCTAYHAPLFIIREVGKFLDDQNAVITALATVVIACFTVTLARVGRQQGEDMRQSLKIARDGANAAIESNKLTRETLIAEYRPRFRVTMTPLRETIEYDKAGDLNLRIRVVGKNVGRGVAYGATIPWIVNYQTDGKDVQSKIDDLRKSASQWVEFMRHPTYPEEEIEREFPIKIFKAELERTWLSKKDAGIQYYYIITSVFYRDGSEPPNIYESTPAGYLTFFGPMAPFPRSGEEFDMMSGGGREGTHIHELLSRYT